MNLFGIEEKIAAFTGGKWVNLAVRVEGYTPTQTKTLKNGSETVVEASVFGKNLKTGEDVVVELDAERVSKKVTSEFSPPALHLLNPEWSPKSASATEQGRLVYPSGVMFFSQCEQTGENTYKAGWVSTVHHGTERDNEMRGFAFVKGHHYLIRNPETNQVKGGFSFMVTDDQFEKNLPECIKSRYVYGKDNKFVVVPKVYTDIEKAAMHIRILMEKGLGAVLRFKFLNEDGYFNVLPIEAPNYQLSEAEKKAWYDKRIKKEIETDIIKAKLAAGELNVEVIPTLFYVYGSATKADVDKPRFRSKHERFNVRDENGHNVPLYTTGLLVFSSKPMDGDEEYPIFVVDFLEDGRNGGTFYKKLNTAAYFAETENGVGSLDAYLNKVGGKEDNIVKPEKKEKSQAGNAANSVMARAAQQARQDEQYTPSRPSPSNYEQPSNTFDDDIPF